jgi:hypothetical protein
MAVTTLSDFKVYEQELYSGLMESLAQNIMVFNAASRGTVVLEDRRILGNYEKRSFLKKISGVVARRAATSTRAATAKKITQDERITVKIKRRYGPVDSTIDAWKMIGQDPREFSRQLGRDLAEEKLADLVNTSLLCGETAISGQSGLNYDATGQSTKTLTHTHLVSGQAKRGDKGNEIRAWAMHSKPYYDLVKQAISDNVFEVAGATIMSGNVATFNRPTIVSDASALVDLNGSATDTYNVLGLVPGAIVCTVSEPETIVTEVITGLDNLVVRIQGEWSFNVEVLGFQWDVTDGGANPTDTKLGTTTNWDLAFTSNKQAAGIRVKVQ